MAQEETYAEVSKGVFLRHLLKILQTLVPKKYARTTSFTTKENNLSRTKEQT